MLQGPVVEEAVQQALTSPAIERALTEALDSEMIDRLWERLLASDEYGHLKDDYANLLRVGQVGEGDFDSTGRLRFRDPKTGQPVRIGRFDASGRFLPPTPGSTEEFEAAMDLAKLSAESYTMATDRIAAALTTALVVIAAVVTTVLTAGAAASIWIPVLVTAGAGLVGMGGGQQAYGVSRHVGRDRDRPGESLHLDDLGRSRGMARPMRGA